MAVFLMVTTALPACGDGGATVSHHQLGERAAVRGWPDVVAVELQRDVDRSELFAEDTFLVVETPTHDEEVVVVRVRLVNDEGEPFQIDPFFMFTLRSQGKEIDATYELSADRVMEDQTLPPDREIEGVLAYTIARGLRELELVYQPGVGEALEEVFENLADGKLRRVEVDHVVISLE